MPWTYDDGTPVPPNLIPPNLKSGPPAPVGPPAPPPPSLEERLERRIMPDEPWGSRYRPPPPAPTGKWTYDDGTPVPPALVPENLRGGPPTPPMRMSTPWEPVEMNPTAQRFQDWVNRQSAKRLPSWVQPLAPKTPGEIGAQAGGTVGLGIEALGTGLYGPESLPVTREVADILTLLGSSTGALLEAKPGQRLHTLAQEDIKTGLGVLMAHWLLGGIDVGEGGKREAYGVLGRLVNKLPFGLSRLTGTLAPAGRIEAGTLGRLAPDIVKGTTGIGSTVLQPVLRAIRPELPILQEGEEGGGG